MNRRTFLGGLVATAPGLLAPEPVRVYSFLPGDVPLRSVTTRLRIHDVPPVDWPPGFWAEVQFGSGAILPGGAVGGRVVRLLGAGESQRYRAGGATPDT